MKAKDPASCLLSLMWTNHLPYRRRDIYLIVAFFIVTTFARPFHASYMILVSINVTILGPGDCKIRVQIFLLCELVVSVTIP